jgi:putative lipoprotein
MGACGSEPSSDLPRGRDAPGLSDAVVQGTFRGMAVYDVDANPRFEPCGELASAPLALVDSSDGDLTAAYQELAGEPGAPLYVEVQGRVEPADGGGPGPDYERQLVVIAVRRASMITAGCEEALDGVEFRATGNEPFWALQVTTSGITLERMDRETIQFPYSPPVDSAGLRIYRTQGANGMQLRLALQETRCQDGMSGFWFAFSANVTLDGETLRGCAAEGW